MATIWEDTFESGNALAVSYTNISNSESNATCGRGGGWGCRTTGTDNQKYGGYFGWESSVFVPTNYFRATFDSDRSSSLPAKVGGWCIYVNDQPSSWNGLVFELNHGMPDQTQLYIVLFYGDEFYSASGAITPGTWQTAQVEGWFSTHTETTPGNWEPNLDGRIKVTVDGVSVIDQSNIQVSCGNATVTGICGVAGIHVGPMGNGDNIGIYTDEPTVPYYWTPIANFIEYALNSENFASGQVSIKADVWARDAGATTKLRLWNVPLGTSAGESAAVTATEPTDGSFMATLDLGWHTYRLEVGSDTPGADAFAVGYLVGV